MIRVLVLGGSGMLGHKLCQVLEHRCEVHACFRVFSPRLRATDLFREAQIRSSVNASDVDSVHRALAETGAHWAINCIGVVKQRSEAQDPVEAIKVNSLFPHLLSGACAEHGVRLIHISTDCVFSGKRGRYRESDVPDAEDLYGRSKHLGEVRSPRSLTLRTSIVGRSLFSDLSLLDWFVANSGGRVTGFHNVLYTGLSTISLSQEIWRIMNRFPDLHGLYHVSSPQISKYSLLHLVNQELELDIELDKDEDVVCDRTLVSDEYWASTENDPPTWPSMIAELAADPTDYAGFRSLAP